MRIALTAALVLTLALAGCAPTGGGTADPTTDPKPTETVAPDPVATTVVLSLQGLTVVDQDGEPMEQTQFIDPEPVLTLLSELLGSTPDPTEYPEYGTTTYEWPGVQFGTNGPDYSWVRFDTGEIGGLPVQTSQGITIGSTRAEVLENDVYDIDYDGDGDGLTDAYGLEPVTNNDYESLSTPGQPGTDYIEADLDGDTVSVLRSPSNDYSDV